MLPSKAGIQHAIEYINSCNTFSKKAKEDINKIGSLEMPSEIETWKRARIFSYYGLGLDIFENRIRFILDVIDHHLDRIDIVDQIVRGLLELYIRFLFIVRSNDTEKLKCIIWQDIFSYCNLTATPIIANKLREDSTLLSIDRQILNNLGLDIALFNISMIKTEIMESCRTLRLTEPLRKLIKSMDFPKIIKILNTYYDENEEPKILKGDIFRWYSRLSEQIHGNLFYEVVNLPEDAAINRILGSIILIQTKFLKEIATITYNQDAYDSLLEQFYYQRPTFSHLWDIQH